MEKQNIADICENVCKKLLEINPQLENGKLMWILNGSTLCNFLCNIDTIDGIKVSNEFREKAFNYIRIPKGDIDILYTDNRKFERGFEFPEIKEYQKISLEQRDYNFIDHNGLINECDINELCEYKTINGLKFIAKKPQYLLYYKFKELAAVYHNDITMDNLNGIPNKNILNDVINLYEIATTYCDENELLKLLNNVHTSSSVLHKIYNDNKEYYNQTIKKAISVITNQNAKNDNITAKYLR